MSCFQIKGVANLHWSASVSNADTGTEAHTTEYSSVIHLKSRK